MYICCTEDLSFLVRTPEGVAVAVYTDGACLDNGEPWARAGLGVYFGPSSPFNLSESLSGSQTNQRAEIHAAIRALEKIEELYYEASLPTKSVMIVTDSAYVVGSMTEWIHTWRANGWRTAGGRTIANLSDFLELEEIVQKLERFQITVRFWRVPREFNSQADELAKDAARRSPRESPVVVETLGLYLAE